jgi:exonuclease III
MVWCTEGNVNILNVYGPAGRKTHNDSFINNHIRPLLLGVDQNLLVLVGDWNITLADGERWSNYSHVRASDRGWAIQEIIGTRVVFNVHRQLHPECNKHTFRQISKLAQGGIVRITTSRIDYFLTSKHTTRLVVGSEVLLPPIESNHSPVSITLQLSGMRRLAPIKKTSANYLMFLLSREEYQVSLKAQLEEQCSDSG